MKLTLEQFTKQTNARRTARASDPATRNRAVIDGLRKYASRYEVAGDGKLANKLRNYAEKLEGFLKAQADEQAAMQSDRRDYIGEATTAAAAELQKRLPACFPTEEDARAFAGLLPMVEAKARATAASDAACKHARAAGQAYQSFRSLAELAAVEATGEVSSNTALANLVLAGM